MDKKIEEKLKEFREKFNISVGHSDGVDFLQKALEDTREDAVREFVEWYNAEMVMGKNDKTFTKRAVELRKVEQFLKGNKE